LFFIFCFFRSVFFFFFFFFDDKTVAYSFVAECALQTLSYG